MALPSCHFFNTEAQRFFFYTLCPLIVLICVIRLWGVSLRFRVAAFRFPLGWTKIYRLKSRKYKKETKKNKKYFVLLKFIFTFVSFLLRFGY
jgi:hypothetical protein